MSTRSLARRTVNLVQRARDGALARMLADVAETDTAICMAATRAAELDTPEAGQAMLALPREELVKQGWASREELRVAIDAKRNTREAPFYLRMSHERMCLRYRGQDGESGVDRAVIVMPQDKPQEEGLPLPPAEGPDETAR